MLVHVDHPPAADLAGHSVLDLLSRLVNTLNVPTEIPAAGKYHIAPITGVAALLVVNFPDVIRQIDK